MTRARKRRPKALCRLCLNLRHLVRSHIIPEFCYDKVIDPALGHALVLTRGKEGVGKRQTGQWEYLLCEDCDGRLNLQSEQYFRRVWYDEKALPDRPPAAEVTIGGLDVFRFRLFHLSILWRASIARRADLFHEVQLSTEDEERLRSMLWSGYADDWQGCTFTAKCLTLDGETFHAVADARRLTPHGASRRIEFMYAGCAWTFFVGKLAPPPDVAPFTLQRQGSLRIPVQDLGAHWSVA